MAALWSYARLPFYVGSGLVGLAGSALYYFQNEIIYPRNIPPGARTEVPSPTQYGYDESNHFDIRLPTPDGETLHAYLLKPPNKSKARPVTIIAFHGNAGNIGHRLPIARMLTNELHVKVLMLEYRGYGLSTGVPGEEGLKVDAQTGLDWIRESEECKGDGVLVFGQSLGGAVAVDLVAKNIGGSEGESGAVKGLILENTFLSIQKMIPSAMPVAKYLAPLCHEFWKSEETIPQITGIPVLFLSGLKDEIVPPTHMKQLFRLCKARTVIWKELPNGDHNNTVAEPYYFNYIDDFVQQHVLKDS